MCPEVLEYIVCIAEDSLASFARSHAVRRPPGVKLRRVEIGDPELLGGVRPQPRDLEARARHERLECLAVVLVGVWRSQLCGSASQVGWALRRGCSVGRMTWDAKLEEGRPRRGCNQSRLANSAQG